MSTFSTFRSSFVYLLETFHNVTGTFTSENARNTFKLIQFNLWKKIQTKTKQIPVSILLNTHHGKFFPPHYRRKSNYITYMDMTTVVIRRRQSP